MQGRKHNAEVRYQSLGPLISPDSSAIIVQFDMLKTLVEQSQELEQEINKLNKKLRSLPLATYSYKHLIIASILLTIGFSLAIVDAFNDNLDLADVAMTLMAIGIYTANRANHQTIISDLNKENSENYAALFQFLKKYYGSIQINTLTDEAAIYHEILGDVIKNLSHPELERNELSENISVVEARQQLMMAKITLKNLNLFYKKPEDSKKESIKLSISGKMT